MASIKPVTVAQCLSRCAAEAKDAGTEYILDGMVCCPEEKKKKKTIENTGPFCDEKIAWSAGSPQRTPVTASPTSKFLYQTKQLFDRFYKTLCHKINK